MPTFPEGVNPAEITQDVVKKVYNKLVAKWFRLVDLSDELDLSIPEHSAYAACWHLDSDSLALTQLKVQLFSELRQNLTPDLIGVTTKSPTVLRAGHPKVTLFFQEDRVDVEDGYAPVEGTIGFRIMDQQADITTAQLESIANKIKTQFRSDSDQLWRKGKVMCSYTDWEEGYQLQILCRTASDAKSLVNKILDVQNHSPKWERFQTSENESPSQAFPTVPPQERVLGETIRLDRKRPVATVRFQYAFIQIPGLTNRKILIDRTGAFPDPVVDW